MTEYQRTNKKKVLLIVDEADLQIVDAAAKPMKKAPTAIWAISATLPNSNSNNAASDTDLYSIFLKKTWGFKVFNSRIPARQCDNLMSSMLEKCTLKDFLALTKSVARIIYTTSDRADAAQIEINKTVDSESSRESFVSCHSILMMPG